MTKTKWTTKRIDALVSIAFKYLGQNVTIDMFDLSKVTDAGRAAFINAIGEGFNEATALDTMNRAVAEAIGKYRKDAPGVVPSLDAIPLAFTGAAS